MTDCKEQFDQRVHAIIRANPETQKHIPVSILAYNAWNSVTKPIFENNQSSWGEVAKVDLLPRACIMAAQESRVLHSGLMQRMFYLVFPEDHETSNIIFEKLGQQGKHLRCGSCGATAHCRQTLYKKSVTFLPNDSGVTYTLCMLPLCTNLQCRSVALSKRDGVDRAIKKKYKADYAGVNIKIRENTPCSNCGTTGSEIAAKLLACARCWCVHYCSKECQRLHWKSIHKKLCIAPLGT